MLKVLKDALLLPRGILLLTNLEISLWGQLDLVHELGDVWLTVMEAGKCA